MSTKQGIYEEVVKLLREELLFDGELASLRGLVDCVTEWVLDRCVMS